MNCELAAGNSWVLHNGKMYKAIRIRFVIRLQASHKYQHKNGKFNVFEHVQCFLLFHNGISLAENDSNI